MPCELESLLLELTVLRYQKCPCGMDASEHERGQVVLGRT